MSAPTTEQVKLALRVLKESQADRAGAIAGQPTPSPKWSFVEIELAREILAATGQRQAKGVGA